MVQNILTDGIVSISELKANPHKVIADTDGQPVAVLSRNKPVFYALPVAYYEYLMERLEDVQLMEIVQSRKDEPTIKIDLDDL